MTEIDSNILHVNSTFVDGRPMVYWAYQGNNGFLTLEQARQRADNVFTAAGIAESEAALVQGIKAITSTDKSKGFGKNKDEEMSVAMLRLVRVTRPPLPDGINVIYGFYTREALVEMFWYGAKIQESPQTVRHHAIALIEAAECSESDAFFYYFLQDNLNLAAHEAYPLIQAFRLYRQRRELESLLSENRGLT